MRLGGLAMHTTPSSQRAITATAAWTRTSGNIAVIATAGPILLAIGWVLIGHLPDSPLWIATTRVLPAGLILLILRPAWPRGAWWHRSAILGLANFGGFFTLQAIAVHHIPAGVAATITATQALLVPLGAVVFVNTPLRRTQLLPATTGILGIALLVLHSADHLDAIGITAAAGTCLCNTLGLLLTRRWTRPDGVHHLTLTGWQMTAGGLLLLPAAVITEGALPPYTAATAAIAAVVTASTAAAFGILFGAVHKGLPPATISRLMLLCPTIVTIAGWLLYQLTLTPLQILGALLVILPVAAACKPEPTARHRVTTAHSAGRHRRQPRRPSDRRHGKPARRHGDRQHDLRLGNEAPNYTGTRAVLARRHAPPKKTDSSESAASRIVITIHRTPTSHRQPATQVARKPFPTVWLPIGHTPATHSYNRTSIQ
jgi:probable blue pigment (indigoidine) exporter